MATCSKCKTECENHHYITRDDRILCPTCWEEEYAEPKRKPKRKEVKDAK